MLAAKIYGLLWLLVATIASVLYLTDSFTFATTIMLGFITSLLGGTALLVVYPAMLSERISAAGKISSKTKPNTTAARSLQEVNQTPESFVRLKTRSFLSNV